MRSAAGLTEERGFACPRRGIAMAGFLSYFISLHSITFISLIVSNRKQFVTAYDPADIAWPACVRSMAGAPGSAS